MAPAEVSSGIRPGLGEACDPADDFPTIRAACATYMSTPQFSAWDWEAMDLHQSLDWFKGKSTGNHGFSHQFAWVFLEFPRPSVCSLQNGALPCFTPGFCGTFIMFWVYQWAIFSGPTSQCSHSSSAPSSLRGRLPWSPRNQRFHLPAWHRCWKVAAGDTSKMTMEKTWFKTMETMMKQRWFWWRNHDHHGSCGVFIPQKHISHTTKADFCVFFLVGSGSGSLFSTLKIAIFHMLGVRVTLHLETRKTDIFYHIFT